MSDLQQRLEAIALALSDTTGGTMGPACRTAVARSSHGLDDAERTDTRWHREATLASVR